MKRVRRPRPSSYAALVVAIAAAGIVGAFAACNDFTPPGETGSSANLTISPKTAHLNVGGTLQLAARGASGAVAWSSSDETVATVNLGKVTAVGSGSVTIRAVSGTSHASANITVTTAAAISVSNANLTFNGIPSAAIPDSQTVNITNAGQDTLTGLAIDSISYGTGATDWLSANLTQTDAPSTLIVKPKTSALAAGSYTATIFVSSPVVTTGPQLIAVRFTLVRPASIALGSSGATFSAQQASALPSQQTIAVTNGGDAPLSGLAVGTIIYSSGASGWLDANVTPSVAPASLVLRPNTTSLTPGDYTATVPLTSTVAGVAPASATITYHVTAAPTPATIVVSQTSLTFSTIVGGTAPVQQTINVTDGGQLALTGVSVATAYAAGQPANWLTVTAGGTTAPLTISVQPNTASLAAGTYTATLTISSSVATNTPQTVSVSYTLLRPAAIVLGSSTATFAAQQSTTVPSQQSIAISNGGDAPLTGLAVGNIGYSAGATGWLNASVTSASAPASLLLQPNSTALTVGDYTATVPVTSSVAATMTVTVTYHVTAAPTPPVIVLSQSTLSFSGTNGATPPVQQTINVTDGGQVALTGVAVTPSYTNGQPTGWLTITPTGTTAPLSFTVQPNTAALGAGTYNATISVASSVATNSPQTVTVTYTLNRPASIVLGATTATFNAQQGASTPTQQSISVTNGGDAPLTGLAVGTVVYSPNVTPWLVASLTSSSAPPSSLLLQPNTTALTPGDYTATVPITSSVQGVASQSVTVTYHVTAPPPVIGVSSASLTFTAGRNFGALPNQQAITVTSTGGTASGLAVSFTYSGASGWLNTSFTGGTSTPTTLNVQPNTTGLAAGVYSATMHLSSTTPGVVTKDIAVTYIVNDLVLDQSSIAFITTSATPPVATVVNVSNAGSGSITGVSATVTLLTGRPANLNWLSAAIANTVPQSPSATSLTLTVLRADSLGDFTAQVTISAPSMVSKTVSVSYRRQATMAGDIFPILHDSLAPTSTCASCHGAPASFNFNVGFGSPAQAYSSLLTPASTPGHTYVIPGDSANSNLFKLLNGLTVPSGYFVMPPNTLNPCSNGNASCMNSNLRTRIYIWIQQGALQQ